jgi:hypothetical protein
MNCQTMNIEHSPETDSLYIAQASKHLSLGKLNLKALLFEVEQVAV